MTWPTPRTPVPKLGRGRTTTLGPVTLGVIGVNMFIGSYVVAYNYAVLHAFEPGPGEGAAMVNFALQAAFLALVAVIWLTRTPGLERMRSAGPLVVTMALSVVSVVTCHQWASVQ